MGALFLTMSTGLLDTGKHNPKVHTFCASSFFFWTFIACIYNTILSWLLQKETKEFSEVILILKTVTTILMVVLFILNTIVEGEF